MTSPEQVVVWSATVQPYGEFAEKTIADPVTNRMVVMNLRLPGQYDERLLGSLGLQGPYYNWNRWYLPPGVGRYLEADPIAMAGGFNSPFGVDWYSYAGGNPLSLIDPSGLEIFVNWDIGNDRYGPLPPRWAGETFIRNNGGHVSRCTCSCGNSDCKFDATVNLSLWRQFLDESAKGLASCDSPGLTIAQHEDLHVADFRNGLGAPALNGAYKTEGFSSRAACERAQAGFARWLKGTLMAWFQALDVMTHARTRMWLPALAMAAACAASHGRPATSQGELSLRVRYPRPGTDVRVEVVNCGPHAMRFSAPLTAGTRSYFWVDSAGVDRDFGNCSGTVHSSEQTVVLQPKDAWRVPCEPIAPPAEVAANWRFRFEVDLETEKGPARLVAVVAPNRTEAGGCDR